MQLQDSPGSSGRHSSALADSKKAEMRKASNQVVHYTKNGILFVYDLEDEETGTEAGVSTTYQNPAFHSSTNPSIDWGT